MIKNIKTKATIKDIKTLDKKKMLDSFNKNQIRKDTSAFIFLCNE